MKITDVTALYLGLPEIKARADGSQDALLAKIDTDADIVGWGESDGCRAAVEAIIEAPISHLAENGLRDILIGKEPLEVGRTRNKVCNGTVNCEREGAANQKVPVVARCKKLANHCVPDLNAAATSNVMALEYCVEPSENSRNLAKQPVEPLDGPMADPEEPGLGFEPNFDVIEQYLVSV